MIDKSNQENTMIRLKVWGDLACFTRPEMKVERVSYDVMTPSAARGILEAIFWKPQMRWIIREIEVLNSIEWTNIRRNEVSKKIPISGGTGVNAAIKKGSGKLGIYIEAERQQRAGLLLKNVAYIIHADIRLTNKAGKADSLIKYQEMFKRRVNKGQCFHTPYFGCREFPANFSAPDGTETPLATTTEFGWMLHDMDYSGKDPVAQFFKANMENGRIRIPPPNAAEVM
ncbi:MAG TPA: type I-C CRISPR-associated protein Cas5 [Calditrichaeota bacterium]|nr:type I-C CRISPR-associated protein Cas5 [Calditrichota bacterium]